MRRVFERGAVGRHLGQHEIGRRTSVGLRHVDETAVAFDDSQELEGDHAIAFERPRDREHRAAGRRRPPLFERAALAVPVQAPAIQSTFAIEARAGARGGCAAANAPSSTANSIFVSMRGL